MQRIKEQTLDSDDVSGGFSVAATPSQSASFPTSSHPFSYSYGHTMPATAENYSHPLPSMSGPILNPSTSHGLTPTQQQQQLFSDLTTAYDGDSDHTASSFPSSPVLLSVPTQLQPPTLPQRIVRRNSSLGVSYMSNSVPADNSFTNPYKRFYPFAHGYSPSGLRAGCFGAAEGDEFTQRE
jgi:hypothetical protein